MQINNFKNILIYKTILKNAKKGKMFKHFDKFKIRNSQRSNFNKSYARINKYPYKLIIDKSRIKFKIENIKKNKNKKKYFHRMGCSFDIVRENNLEKLKQ